MRNRILKVSAPVALSLAAAGVSLALPDVADGRQINNTTRTNVNRNVNHNVNVNQNVNHNVNVNQNVNVNRHVDVDVDVDDHWHPVAGVVAVAATAAVVGSVVHSVPPSCVPVMINGMTYQQCGSTWYQPQYVGSTVQYVVIAPPR